MSQTGQWERYLKYRCGCGTLGITLDISRMQFSEGFWSEHASAMSRAFDAMEALERGAIANPDENRRVGHYWLRAPQLAPEPAWRVAITDTVQRIQRFSRDVHAGVIAPARGRFEKLLVIGIGGSALGPQFVADALGRAGDPLTPAFFDNTDPDGMDRVVKSLGGALGQTMVVVISKSGGTKETRNGMLTAQRAFAGSGLDFSKHAVAVTGEGSELDRTAVQERWLARFPMWDWVGGRTSELSAVGLLPAALQGIDIDGLLRGAGEMDELTRSRDVLRNPASLLALMWFHVGGGRGAKDMVVLPYKDRLLLLSRYLQQLVMESLGKERDLNGVVVEQGLAVYGNKGSTDQHAYVQQLRDGLHNFFVTFVEVLVDQEGAGFEVEPDVTAGDYLHGFLLGTREALTQKQRESLTLTLTEVNAATIGALIALFERAVGLYASLVNVNAYHQPGVEAGKVAAGEVLALQRRLLAVLRGSKGPRSLSELAGETGASSSLELVSKVLEHLAANRRVIRAGDAWAVP